MHAVAEIWKQSLPVKTEAKKETVMTSAFSVTCITDSILGPPAIMLKSPKNAIRVLL